MCVEGGRVGGGGGAFRVGTQHVYRPIVDATQCVRAWVWLRGESGRFGRGFAPSSSRPYNDLETERVR